jgi:adenine-specific DNA-methyltransferase
MKKLTMHTPDITEGNITKITELFPNVITEKEGADGTTTRAIDFDLLRQALSSTLVEDDSERYRLDWPGKKASLLKANTPITKTLRPDRESSVNFDTTENVFIEGDNFEVLKVLQESYLSKIKMIYIDPPYNTGKDFVYKDNFATSKGEYEEELGVEDGEGGKLFRNTDTNGRFHSDWLSMMYERLIIARDLLKDDGVIFISIDDNEVHNLRKISDEIFGGGNFIADFVWIKKEKASGVPPKDMVLPNYEHVLCYHNKDEIKFLGQDRSYISYKKDKDGRYWRYMPIQATGEQDNWFDIEDPATGIKYNGNWAFSRTAIQDLISNGKLVFPKNTDGKPVRLVYADEMQNDTAPVFTNLGRHDSEASTKQLIALLDGKMFDFPKPISLITFFVKQVSNDQDIVLDFFSGSATTAHAVMSLNAEDGGNRKFIMVQIPEETPEDSEARKAGYKNIAEISKERIRRAGKKIFEENKESLAKRSTPLDVGFRVYKADTTNMKDVYYHPSVVGQTDLLNFVSNIKEDRTPEDLLTQVILDLGLTLDLPIEKKVLRGNAVYFVAGNALVACFDNNIDFGIVEDIAKYEPLKVVFKDASFKEEQDRTNVDTKFKRLSPDTIITVL